MKNYVMLLLLPLTVFAQASFDPVQVDDGRGISYFYPAIENSAGGNVLCTWALEADGFVGAYGQHVNQSGRLIGVNEVYQEVAQSEFYCPPKLHIARFTGGGHAKLFLHS